MLAQLTTMANVYWLLDILLKSSVLLALAGLATLACWRASAALRHLVWTLAVIGVLLMPLLSALLPAWYAVRLPEWKAPPARIQARATRPIADPVTPAAPQPATTTPAAPAAAIEATTPQELAPPAASSPPLWKSSIQWSVLLFLIWGIGTLLVLGWWAYGYIVARGILRRATPEVESWADEVPAGVRLLLSAEIAMPLLLGILRPTILLPASAVEWPDARRRVVLLHELTHHQRRDLPTCLLVQLACTLYWMNPLIWLAAYRMRTERETACDDAVLAADIAPSDYAAHLLAVASALQGHRLTPVAGIAMARSSKVGKRIKGVLDTRRNRKSLSSWAVLAAVVVMLPLLVTIAVAEVSPAAAKANKSAPGDGQHYTASTQLPTFTAIAGQRWNTAVASPSGRYLAVPNPRISGELGIWVCDLQTNEWTKVWDQVGKIQWLPDESGMIVGVGLEDKNLNEDGSWPHCTFYRISLTGKVTKVTEISDLVDWIVIPDDSGLVATRVAGHGIKDEATSTETSVFLYAKKKWESKHISPLEFQDGLFGKELALRKHGDDWVLSYDMSATGDNGELWLNLNTGENMQVHGNSFGNYSSDGRYVVDDSHILYSIESWPIPPLGHDWGGNIKMNKIHLFDIGDNIYWAPDAKHIAFSYTDPTVYDLKGTRIRTINGEFETWVGGEQILVQKDNKLILYPINGEAGRVIFLLASAEDKKKELSEPAPKGL